MRDLREIKVWEKAHLLTLEIYKATASFPTEERYGDESTETLISVYRS